MIKKSRRNKKKIARRQYTCVVCKSQFTSNFGNPLCPNCNHLHDFQIIEDEKTLEEMVEQIRKKIQLSDLVRDKLPEISID